MSINKIINNYLQEIGFSNLPTGWDKNSVKKFAKTLGGKDVDIKDDKWFYNCVKKIKDMGEIDNPESYCATLKDEVLGTTKWRGEE
ncbi:MAG: hypothetical protein ACOC2W_00400 [bacterium]